MGVGVKTQVIALVGFDEEAWSIRQTDNQPNKHTDTKSDKSIFSVKVMSFRVTVS